MALLKLRNSLSECLLLFIVSRSYFIYLYLSPWWQLSLKKGLLTLLPVCQELGEVGVLVNPLMLWLHLIKFQLGEAIPRTLLNPPARYWLYSLSEASNGRSADRTRFSETKAVVLKQGYFCTTPSKTSGNVWDICGCHNWWRSATYI